MIKTKFRTFPAQFLIQLGVYPLMSFNMTTGKRILGVLTMSVLSLVFTFFATRILNLNNKYSDVISYEKLNKTGNDSPKNATNIPISTTTPAISIPQATITMKKACVLRQSLSNAMQYSQS